MLKRKRTVRIAVGLLVTMACTAALRANGWTPAQVEELRTMWIGSLEPVPSDPTNKFADDERAANLGRSLFFDKRLSKDGRVSCATCHRPETEFQDSTPLATGVGTTNRRTMP